MCASSTLRSSITSVDHIDNDGLLLTSSTGTLLSRNSSRTKFWSPAVTAAEVQQAVTFHRLGAAHAAWLPAGGADIIVVQERPRTPAFPTQQYTGALPYADEDDDEMASWRGQEVAWTPLSEAGQPS